MNIFIGIQIKVIIDISAKKFNEIIFSGGKISVYKK